MKSVLYLVLFTLGLSQLAFAAPNCPNRPAGATTVLDTPFNTTDGEGQLWEVYPGAGKLVQVSGAPGSPSSANASILSPGSGTGGQQTIWPKIGREQPLSNLYMCMVWKMNPEFVGIQTNNKLVFLAAQDFTFGRAASNGVLSVPKRGPDYPPTSFQMIFGHNSNGLNNSHTCVGETGEICYPNVKDTPIYPGVWYTVEAFVAGSSCTTCRNGTVRWWINGELQGNYTNLNYGDGIVNEWQINHTWDNGSDKQCGPPTNPSNPRGRDCRADQIHYFDHVILASVGGLAPGPVPMPQPQPQPAPQPAPQPEPVPSVGTVNDLAVGSITTNSVNISFTEVTDGAGGAAEYDLRYGPAGSYWGTMSSINSGTCAVPIMGSSVGVKRTCTISGLTSGTQYQFQIIPFRGTMNQGAVYGGISSVVNATTAQSSPQPQPQPGPQPLPQPSNGAPIIQFSYPNAGAVLSDRVFVYAQVASSVAISEVRFYVDGLQVGPEIKQAPYVLLMDTQRISNGTHQLSAIAKDISGASSAAAKISVVVNNTTSGSSAYDPLTAAAGCVMGQTKTNQINASMSLIWLLPLAGLMRRRKKD